MGDIRCCGSRRAMADSNNVPPRIRRKVCSFSGVSPPIKAMGAEMASIGAMIFQSIRPARQKRMVPPVTTTMLQHSEMTGISLGSIPVSVRIAV